MPLWNNTDSESSKPNWLTEEQRRNCVRTVRGWEMPAGGAASWTVGNTGSTGLQTGLPAGFSGGAGYSYRSSTTTVPMELLVCLPHRNTFTGATPSNFTPDRRGFTQAGPGLTSVETNYKPYITWPVHGSTVTQPYWVYSATGVTVSQGITSYFPILAADANTTDAPWTLSLSITGPTSFWAVNGGPAVSVATMTADITGGGQTCFNYTTGYAATLQSTIASTFARNKGFGGITYGAIPFRVPGAASISGNYTITATVTDRLGATGISVFTLSVTGS